MLLPQDRAWRSEPLPDPTAGRYPSPARRLAVPIRAGPHAIPRGLPWVLAPELVVAAPPSPVVGSHRPCRRVSSPITSSITRRPPWLSPSLMLRLVSAELKAPDPRQIFRIRPSPTSCTLDLASSASPRSRCLAQLTATCALALASRIPSHENRVFRL